MSASVLKISVADSVRDCALETMGGLLTCEGEDLGKGSMKLRLLEFMDLSDTGIPDPWEDLKN